MYSRTAPTRVRSLASWLISQGAATAGSLITARLATLGAHRYQFSLLAALDEFGPLSQAELGRRCGLDRSDVAGAVAELDGRGLLDRAPDPADRRRNVVRITTAGREHLATLDALVTSAQEEFLAPLSPDERALLLRLLTRLTEHHTPPA